MAKRSARLQVPIEQSVLEQLETLADRLGFDSVQAMIRFWAKAEINQDGRPPALNVANGIVLRYVELILALNPQPPNPDTALHYLIKQLQHHRMKKALKALSHPPTSDKIFGT